MSAPKTKYKPEYPAMLIQHMAEGLSFDSFAGKTDLTRVTLYEWIKIYPEFDYAKQVGSSKNLLFWEKMGIAGALGRVKNFNPTAWIFNMKNRFQWRDMGQVTSDGNITIKLAYKNPKETKDGRSEKDEIAEVRANDSLQESDGFSARLVQIAGDETQDE